MEPKRPTVQFVHVLAAASEYLPRGQRLQKASPPVAENEPAEQGVQVLFALNDPGEHELSHVAAPAAENFPEGHAPEHFAVVCPVVFPTNPARQLPEQVAVVTPTLIPNLPSGQLVQLADPAAE